MGGAAVIFSFSLFLPYAQSTFVVVVVMLEVDMVAVFGFSTLASLTRVLP